MIGPACLTLAFYAIHQAWLWLDAPPQPQPGEMLSEEWMEEFYNRAQERSMNENFDHVPYNPENDPNKERRKSSRLVMEI